MIRSIMTLVVVLLVVIALTTLGGCGNTEESGSDYSSGDSGNSTTVSTDSAEYKLATIEAGHAVDLDDSRVGEFAQVLDSLQNKYKDYPSRNHVGDVLVHSQAILKQRGVTMGLLELAREFDASVPSNASGKFKLSEVAAAYIVLSTRQ